MNRCRSIALLAAFFVFVFVFALQLEAQTLTLIETGGPCDAPNPAVANDVPGVDGGNLARGSDAVAFATPSFAEGTPPAVAHKIVHLNDGLYSNGQSWIGQWCPGTDPADEDVECACPAECVCPDGVCPMEGEATKVYAGIYFLSGLKTIGQIAFGRDATGVGTDRAGGTYEVQYTQDDIDFNSHAAIEGATWTSLGSADVEPLLRHLYEFEEEVDARGVRILMNQFWAIDEIEVGATISCVDTGPCGVETPPQLQTVEIGGPVMLDLPAETPGEVPSFGEGNVARALDAAAFGSPTFADTAPGTPAADSHKIRHLNDGNYGNAKSWIASALGTVTGDVYFGVYFQDGPKEITQIAYGRDNLVNGAEDRSAGENIVQITMDEFDFTSDSGVGTASWVCVGRTDDAAQIFEFDRRLFNLDSPVMARAVRVLTGPDNGIDEIEIGGSSGISICDPRCLQLVEVGGPVDPPNPAAAEDVPGFSDGNFAQAGDAQVFATPTFGDAVPAHAIPHLIDGLYGNGNSWIGEFCIGTDPDVSEERDCPGSNIFGGIYWTGGPRGILDVAIGRDATGGGTDRAGGTITVQTTLDTFDPNDDVAADAATWTSQGQFPYAAGRQRYQLGGIVQAQAVRFLTAQSNAVDEIEAGQFVTAATGLTLVELGGSVSPPVATGDVPSDGEGNLARAAGAVAFGSPTFAQFSIDNLNDGVYGGANMWIGEFCPGTDPAVMEERDCPGEDIYAGIYFTTGEQVVEEVAIGRDATGAGTDRAAGSVTVQYTRDEFDAQDSAAVAAADWLDAGDPVAYSALRQRFRFATAVSARAVRVTVAQFNAVDELEVGRRITKFSMELTETGSPLNPGNPSAGPGEVPASEEGNLARDADSIAFGTPTFPQFSILNLNDGLYGGANMWIGEFCPDTDPETLEERDCPGAEIFAGIYFTGGTKTVDGLAIGRENLVLEADRSGGRITVQTTEDEFDPASNAAATAASWSTVGIFPYDSLRQRFQFGTAVNARAVRVLLNQFNGVDEIELYGSGAEPPPPFDLIEIEGPTAPPVAADSVPTAEQGNLARADGSVAFGTPTFEDLVSAHRIVHLNDGLYGNGNSWLGEFCPDTDPGVEEVRDCPDAEIFAGIYFGNGAEMIEDIAIGRGGTDRAAGVNTFQYTADEFDFTNNAATSAANWITLGSIPYDPMRNRYRFPPVSARAIRILTAQFNGIDEIEVGKINRFSMELAEVGPNPVAPDTVPTFEDGNLARGPNAIAIGTPTFDFFSIDNLNDGLYGGAEMWIGEFCPDTDPETLEERDCPGANIFAGIYFNGSAKGLGPLVAVGELAIGRENTVEGADRSGGRITVQYTTDAFDPASNAGAELANWIHVGIFDYQSKRQRFVFGETVLVRAVRVLLNQFNGVDELELFGGTISSPIFRRGDHDGSGFADITDGINLLSFLFLGTFAPACRDASDFDNSGDIDITDAINLLTHLFIGTVAIPDPGTTTCGPDPVAAIAEGDVMGLPAQPAAADEGGLPFGEGPLGCEEYPGPDFLPDSACE